MLQKLQLTTLHQSRTRGIQAGCVSQLEISAKQKNTTWKYNGSIGDLQSGSMNNSSIY